MSGVNEGVSDDVSEISPLGEPETPIEGVPPGPRTIPADADADADTGEEDVLPGEEIPDELDFTIGEAYVQKGRIFLPIGKKILALSVEEAEAICVDLIDAISRVLHTHTQREANNVLRMRPHSDQPQ